MIRFLSAFIRTRWLATTLKTRADVERWQASRLKRLLRKTLPTFRFYQSYDTDRLEALPIIDKTQLMSDFATFNSAGISTADGWEIFEGRMPQKRGYSLGASTGTSGNRGLYVVSDAERQEWLGVMLAKTLPRFPLEGARIALVLPLNSALYRTAARMAGLGLRFFDLNTGLHTILPQIVDYAPDTIIAPPKVLRALAEDLSPLRPRRLFSGAEVLDPLDRIVIESHFGVDVREIYMATEGLLGVACAHGTLHLCEDVMHFAFEAVTGSELVSPVITDFTRTTQAMCRYRMNDLLRLSPHPCRCGSPYVAVAEIAGRCDDLFVLGGKTVTPDILRNAVVDADRSITDFRLQQTGPADIELILSADIGLEIAGKAITSLERRLSGLGIAAAIQLRQEPLSTSARKLRRVERIWVP
jgi:putative adenylate-forming enzyme